MAHAFHAMILGLYFRPVLDTYENVINFGKYQNVKRTKCPNGKV